MEYGDIDNFNHSGDMMECADSEMDAYYRAKREGRLTHPTVETVPETVAVEAVAEKTIVIAKVPRGTYDFQTPFKHQAFLDDFKNNIGKRFWFWNEFKKCWQITPLDAGMIDLIAAILRRHFKGYTVEVKHA